MLVDNYRKFVLYQKANTLSRDKEEFNLENAKKIGILFDATIIENYKIVKNFVYQLAKDNRTYISALGYVDFTRKYFEHISVLHIDCFAKNQLNWFGKPKGVLISNFLKYEFDLLIDLSQLYHFPLMYIATASIARHKVGLSKWI